MENKHSSSGIGEDLIRAFVQFGCAEMHLKTLYEKTQAEIENAYALDEEVGELLEKLDAYRADIGMVANLRRDAMLQLHELFPDGDKDAWCLVKHLGIGAMCAWESWQASDENPELLFLAMQANKAFVKAVTRFIGMEITECAACLTDFLKAGGNIDG